MAAKKKPKKKAGSKPTNPSLYARVKAETKRKFDVYPSAYANAYLVRQYKKRGGGLEPAFFFGVFLAAIMPSSSLF